MTAVPPRPTAPDATAGDGRREALIEFLREHNPLYYEDAVDELMAGPLRDVLAAAARDAELRAKLRELVAFYDRHEYSTLSIDDLRAALDDPS